MKLGLHLHAGHGLDYRNVEPIAQIPGMDDLDGSLILRAGQLANIAAEIERFVGFAPCGLTNRAAANCSHSAFLELSAHD